MRRTQDLNVRGITPLIPPRELKAALPLTEDASDLVANSRDEIRRILAGEDDRLLAIVGPCSIHDPEAALDYANRLATLRRELAGQLCIVMRVYFEKPRTTIGWRGLIYDPHLDGSGDIAAGLRLARRILTDIVGLGLPVATESLDPIVPQYTADLVTWTSIGARTTQSQTHREMASGFSMPVGFKNNTEGNLQIAVDAMVSSREPHTFLGIDQDGVTSIVETTGNPWVHAVLRGGRLGPNYDPRSIQTAKQILANADLPPAIIVDCSHANSGKRPANQDLVLDSLVQQRLEGERAIVGFMLESNLEGGRQEIPTDRAQLRYGVSVTDPCLDWENTARLLRTAATRLADGVAGC